MFWRALLAFIAMPGIVALTVPLWVGQSHLDQGGELHMVGLLPSSVGLLLLLWCVYEFYVSGKGTLAPWSPPKHLVTRGPYRVSRNPMYVGVLLMLFGWALLFWSPVLATYNASMAVIFHLRIILGEEPWLARTHGEAWNEYRARTPRWLI